MRDNSEELKKFRKGIWTLIKKTLGDTESNLDVSDLMEEMVSISVDFHAVKQPLVD